MLARLYGVQSLDSVMEGKNRKNKNTFPILKSKPY